MYLKAYSTDDVLSAVFNLDFGLEGAATTPNTGSILGQKARAPERKVTSVEEFYRCFPEARDLLVNGTEHPIQKPKNHKRRKKLYSGKKKATTRKHIIIATPKKRILVLGRSKTGRRHDKRVAEQQQHLEDSHQT